MIANVSGLIATLALAGAPLGAPAPLPAGTPPPMPIELRTKANEADAPWAADLSRRLRETFGEVGVGRFVVTLEPNADGVVVGVADDTGLTTTRTFSVGEPGISAWLFVKSTIERSLRERESVAVTPPPREVQPPAPVAVRAPSPPREARAPLRPRLLGLARLEASPALGLAVGLHHGLTERALVHADVGYARSLPRHGIGRDLELHAVLFGVGLAAAWGSSPSLACGMRVEGAAKFVAAGGRSRTTLDAAAGPFFESQLAVGGVTLLLRAGLLGRLVRQRYVLEEGRVSESAWLADLAAGVAF